ncbi:MAG: dTDP-4-amino-4,6-dideoxygalactose transaminase [Cytophagaceae bacterium]
MIPFNKPFIIGKELDYIRQAVESGKISGDGSFTKKCQDFFSSRYGFHKVLLTTSCTDALEMSALLLNLKEGDEVIMPSFTYVSTATAFALRGVRIVFADIEPETMNIDPACIEKLITPKTKAIVVVHYAGIACRMDEIMAIAQNHKIVLIEDAALSIGAFYKGKALGSFGSLATYSFHETKNIIAGEGGALIINDPAFSKRAEIIREKGTNRSEFFRGEVDKYKWVDLGSSFLPSEIIAAFLYAQLEHIDQILEKRISIWNTYDQELGDLEKKNKIRLPRVPAYASKNGQLFYILCKDLGERSQLIDFLGSKKIKAVFHYLPLHQSPYYQALHDGRVLPVSCDISERLLRLPLFYTLEEKEQSLITEAIYQFYK